MTATNAKQTDARADEDGLIVPGFQVQLGDYLRQVWARREYMLHVPGTTLRGKHMNTALGNLWHLLNPIISIGTYFFMFGVVLGTRTGVENFMAFLTIGVFVYGFTQRSVTAASKSITSNKGLIRSLKFPRAILPITSVAVEFVAFLPGLALALVIAILGGVVPMWSWLALPAVLAIQLAMNVGMGLFSARLNNSFRDFAQILPFVFRMVFYGSGVLFSLDRYVSEETRRYFLANPIYDLIEVYRWLILGHASRVNELLAAIVWTVIMVPLGLVIFRRAEATYGA